MPQIGWSDVEVLDHDVPAVLAHVCRCDDWRLLAVHNLGRRRRHRRRSSSAQVPEGSVLRDVLDGRARPADRARAAASRCASTADRGQWLRVLAPGEQAYA